MLPRDRLPRESPEPLRTWSIDGAERTQTTAMARGVLRQAASEIDWPGALFHKRPAKGHKLPRRVLTSRSGPRPARGLRTRRRRFTRCHGARRSRRGRRCCLSKAWYPPTGGTIDHRLVRDELIDLSHRFAIQEVAYDPSQIHHARGGRTLIRSADEIRVASSGTRGWRNGPPYNHPSRGTSFRSTPILRVS
jgi:hypothetical protein